MKISLILLSCLLAFLSIKANAITEVEIPVLKLMESYEKVSATIYDEEVTGENFPYRITVSMEVSGCTGGKFLFVKMPNSLPGAATYFFTFDAITPAIICQEPPRILSQSFEFPKKESFIDLVVPKGAIVKIERLLE